MCHPARTPPPPRTPAPRLLHCRRTSLCLAERFERWREEFGVTVVPTTSGFMDAWDGDDSLVYEPDSTAAFILSEWRDGLGPGGGRGTVGWRGVARALLLLTTRPLS